jgi:seryl-tRNA synthetase
VEALALNCRRRKSSADPHLVAALYDDFGALKREADLLRQARNENAAAMKVRPRRSQPRSASCATQNRKP